MMFIRLDALSVWRNKEVKERLNWYYQVMCNIKPAKFLICKRLPSTIDLKNSSEDELWREHEILSKNFQEVYNKINSNELKLDEMEKPSQNFLDLKAELLKRIITHCHLCEWRCGVNRIEGKRKGACKLNSLTRVSTWFHHYGEEPPLVGIGGSGTIFFTGCTFRCCFCQNWDISQDPLNGAEVDSKKLAIIMKNLREEGAHNINFVGGEPTMHLHTILDGMKILNVNVPMLWNSNMYCSLEAMKILIDVIDIWLPDFKYGNDSCAIRLSKVPKYFSVVSRNHAIAQAQGDMIIRHLVLPNHVECCTKPVLEWISKNCKRALVNIMAQYHPDHLVLSQPSKYPEICRRPSNEEMREAYKYAEELGLIYEPVS
ncbi:MAG: radical SAM protein [Nitrososphaerales archaeon]